MTWRVLLDTDIGTDVDDALALCVLLGAPGVSIDAITVAYGDTQLRARIARRLLELAGRTEIPVGLGDGSPLTPGVPVFWPGHEGEDLPGLDLAVTDADAPAAEDLIAASLAAAPGEIDVVAIGPLANLARALARPLTATSIRCALVMGGDFGPALDEPEHNWGCDPVAAARVLAAGVPLTVCGIDQTLRLRLGSSVAERFDDAGPLGAALASLMRRWWRQTAPDVEDFAHDAVTVMTGLHPELFAFRAASIAVDSAGYSTATAAEAAPHQIVTDFDVAAVGERIVDYIIRASSCAASVHAR